MKFQVFGEDVANCVKDLQKLLATDRVVIKTSGDKAITVGSFEAGKTLIFKLDSKVLAPGGCTVALDTLLGVTKKQKEMEFAANESTLSIRALHGRKTKIENIPTSDVQDLTIHTDKSSSPVKIPEAMLADLKECVKYSAITDALQPQNTPALNIESGKSGLEVLSYCAFHSALVYKSGNYPSVHLALSAKAFTDINALAGKDGFSLVSTDVALLAYNDRFRYQIPAEQFDNRVPLEQFKSILETVLKAKVDVSGKVDASLLLDCMDSLSTLYDDQTKMRATFQGKQVQLAVASSKGTMKEMLDINSAVKTRIEVEMSPKLILDVVRLVKDCTLDMSVVSDSCVIFDTKPDNSGVSVNYVCSLL